MMARAALAPAFGSMATAIYLILAAHVAQRAGWNRLGRCW
jgi:hypothetical protein